MRTLDKKFDVEFEEVSDSMEKALQVQKLADTAMSPASHTRCTYRRLATTFDEADIELNEGLGQLHQLVAATTTATSSMSMGAGDRADNEHEYFQMSVDLLPKILNGEETGDGFELVTTGK